VDQCSLEAELLSTAKALGEMGLDSTQLVGREGAIDVFVESPERIFAGQTGERGHTRHNAPVNPMVPGSELGQSRLAPAVLLL
jgi:hypothetical protein